jgi:hypothetical protein
MVLARNKRTSSPSQEPPKNTGTTLDEFKEGGLHGWATVAGVCVFYNERGGLIHDTDDIDL